MGGEAEEDSSATSESVLRLLFDASGAIVRLGNWDGTRLDEFKILLRRQQKISMIPVILENQSSKAADLPRDVVYLNLSPRAVLHLTSRDTEANRWIVLRTETRRDAPLTPLLVTSRPGKKE